MVFGVLASDAKLTSLEALLMSLFVYSGSAQLAVLRGWTSDPQVLAAAAILIMNAS
jgi:predicted branched-subunit amino acid permease